VFAAGDDLTRLEWRERGDHADDLDHDGVYRAVVLGNRMVGDWRKGRRLVGMLELTRAA
jgi:hypothetical protein